MNQNNSNNNIIDIIEVLNLLHHNKKIILKWVVFSSILGLIIFLFSTKEFTSSTTFIPQTSSTTKSSSLSGLASLTGINIDNGTGNNVISPDLYPQVIGSYDFKLKLLEKKILLAEKEVYVRDYLIEFYKPNIYKRIKNILVYIPNLLFKSPTKSKPLNNIYSISKEDNILFREINNKLDFSYNDKEGFLTLSFTDQNKNIAAQITRIAQNLLQKEIIDYKISSSQEQLNFSIKQYELKKKSFEKLQDEIAYFEDENLNISSSLFRNKLLRLKSELNILNSVVQQLAGQVEQAKLQVNKDTPVFTILEPVSIPFKKSSPSLFLYIAIYFLIGLIFSCFYIIFREDIKKTLKLITKKRD